MFKIVDRAKVTGVFLSSEKVWGTPQTGVWSHLHGSHGRLSAISRHPTVSAHIRDWKDGRGNRWDDSIMHVALTPLPVADGLPGFKNLATPAPKGTDGADLELHELPAEGV